MSEKYLEIEIDEEGNVILDVNGMHGPDCEALTKDLEKELGKVEKKVLKPEHKKKVKEKAGVKT